MHYTQQHGRPLRFSPYEGLFSPCGGHFATFVSMWEAFCYCYFFSMWEPFCYFFLHVGALLIHCSPYGGPFCLYGGPFWASHPPPPTKISACTHAQQSPSLFHMNNDTKCYNHTPKIYV